MTANKLKPSHGDVQDVLMVVEDSRNWATLSDISTMSAVSRAKCQIVLAQLVQRGKIYAKGEGSKVIYGNRHVFLREQKAPVPDTEFRYAKPLFEVHPELLSGKGLRPYIAKPFQAQSLAMISRRS